MTAVIDAVALRAHLASREEFALLDVREQGVHCLGHPFFASCTPLSKLELLIEDLVPRRGVRIVLLDGGTEGLAERAAEKLGQLGYDKVEVLEGGCAGWEAAGGELFSGVNVPSKAFGEFVERQYGTPRIPAHELSRLQEAGAKLVVLDSRPFDEYQRMSIPGGIDTPGAELALRVHDLAPDPDALVVVNCAGRTRSIIGCQALRNAGIANRVVALQNGTMGWELAGYACERGAARIAPAPSAQGLALARAGAARVARRFGVRAVSRHEARRFQRDNSRTLFFLDVRTRDEYERLHIAGTRHAPGGQLVQASDEYLGVRNARVVLVDPLEVRSVMSASWLVQMGWEDVHVLEPAGADGFEGWDTETGRRPSAVPGLEPWATLAAHELTQADKERVVLDLSSSLRYRTRHIPGAWWGVRSRLAEARARMGEPGTLVLTSEDGVLARLAAPEAGQLWTKTTVRVLQGGNASWFAGGHAVESGMSRATTTVDDLWYKPYDHEQPGRFEDEARAYLEWEVGLLERIGRDPSIRFRAFA